MEEGSKPMFCGVEKATALQVCLYQERDLLCGAVACASLNILMVESSLKANISKPLADAV